MFVLNNSVGLFLFWLLFSFSVFRAVLKVFNQEAEFEAL